MVENEKLCPGQLIEGKKTTVELSLAWFLFLVCGGVLFVWVVLERKINVDFWHIFGGHLPESFQQLVAMFSWRDGLCHQLSTL